MTPPDGPAVREWEEYRDDALCSHSHATPRAFAAKADAALAERTKERDERVKVDYFPHSERHEDYTEDCIAGVFAFLAQFGTEGGENPYCEDLSSAVTNLKLRAEDAETRAKALERCGNCGHRICPRYCGTIRADSMTTAETAEARKAGPVCRPSDPCHFTPSRWERRTG
jgi:hypothetical protein